MMAISVIIGVFVSLVVGCASMAMWVARRIRDETARQPAEPRTYARPPLRPGPTWLEETTTRLNRTVHDSGSMVRICCKETADAR
jgi:hypothetical protein